jgi:D-sedoheptulose 7-phosphate isomerase
MGYFENYAQSLSERLLAVEATDGAGASLPVQRAFEAWIRLTRAAQTAGRTHFFIGNGASATMASHMALDASKNAAVPSLAFNDPASLTAIGNDLGYDEAFAAPMGWHGREGDVLVAISSSGRSPNILAGVAAAREKRLSVVTLTGLDPQNPARKAGDLNFYVPGRTYGCVESLHQVLLHCWLDQLLGQREWDLPT